MGKRSVENDIDDVADELLGDLSPEERMAITLEAIEKGNELWLQRLRETAPVRRYRATDRRYTERVRLAMEFGFQALLDLTTTMMLYKQQRLLNMVIWFLELQSEEEPTQEERDATQHNLHDVTSTLEHLYTLYHGYEQFAETELGVSLETWLSFHHEADPLLSDIEQLLEDSVLIYPEEPDDRNVSLDETAEMFYQSLSESWTEGTSQIAG